MMLPRRASTSAQAAEYAHSAGIAILTPAAHAAASGNSTVNGAFIASIKPGTPVVTGNGIADWAAFEQGYGCTYTGEIAAGPPVSGPYQMSAYGIRQSSLEAVWITSPSTYRVGGVHPGSGSFRFDRRFPGPLDPSFHGILVFTNGPLRGHSAIIADNPIHKNKALYFPLDWFATNGKPDTFDPRSSTGCATQAKA